MQLSRSKNVAKAVSFKKIDSLAKYIRVIIDVYSSTEIKRDLWLTDREKEFCIATVIHVLHGHTNPICEESVQIYKKYFGYNTDKTKISDYIGRLRNKKWLTYNKKKKEIKLTPIFYGIDVEMDTITFNLMLGYGPIDRSDSE